ncbi:ATP-binding protein [Rhodospirillum sp. A1_3_36]|uniref:hybrid sensor histidine kinase/response regulator n=1 Tax=Rhodospirillum sp. A1_3_36 TaxID=3391666 RepID=UPI0039A71FA7
MAARQRVLRIRRRYNRWVANETLEDYALRFTATGARRWSAARVANTALGAISFLALEAIGGAITVGYGFENATAAILVLALVIFATGLPICYYAARAGVDIDLLTRGAGFGYIGSTITSLIYASFTFIFFALEAVILAMALEMWLGLPQILGYFLGALVVIPLVTHGITVISRFQVWTQPLWVVLHLIPFVFLGITQPDSFKDWTQFKGIAQNGLGDGFNILAFGAATTVVASLVAQIGEQVDFLRFLPKKEKGNRAIWWLSMIGAGPGWILPGTLKLLAGSYLAFLCIEAGLPTDAASAPTTMYNLVFEKMLGSPASAVAAMGIFVILSQLKINVTNAYAGSIAWSNFFSRLTHSHPGRVVWLVFNVVIALLLMTFGVYSALEHILGLYSVVAIAWVGALFADLVINKPLGLSPAHIEFKRAHLYDINPVGTGAMLIAITLAILAHLGVFGALASAFTAFVALGSALVSAPIIAFLTKGRYYIARENTLESGPGEGILCCICEHAFEREDMAHCTAYGGPICSLCCSLDARCHDICKPERARLPAQARAFARRFAPAWVVNALATRGGRLATTLVTICLCMGAVLSFLRHETLLGKAALDPSSDRTLWMAVLVIGLIGSVIGLLFMLTNESRRVALEEAERQASLLRQEIEAHERTDAQLQKAKDAAEAANFAKSRYIIGVSHEIRSPLNAISGYAQILSRDESIPKHRRDAIGVIRQSAQHLSGLVEGLVDISRIESGQLTLNTDEVRLPELLRQFADMFRMQAQVKGVEFLYEPPHNLPALVHTDEKRFRQILFNLLSNAVKFTDKGHVALSVRLKSEVAEFTVADTGVGIPQADLERVFLPFERGGAEGNLQPGMGLGLTITKLLTEILGGEVLVESTPGQGSTFRVRLFLPALSGQRRPSASPRAQTGYEGPPKRILVVDDDDAHRALTRDVLLPLGFDLIAAENGAQCREILRETPVDLVLMDISMPDVNGWDLAEELREGPLKGVPIVMVSANAHEYEPGGALADPHDAFLVKPIDIIQLTETIGALLALRWEGATVPSAGDAPSGSDRPPPPPPPLPHTLVSALREAIAIGHVRGIGEALTRINEAMPESGPWTDRMRSMLSAFALKELGEAARSVPVQTDPAPTPPVDPGDAPHASP